MAVTFSKIGVQSVSAELIESVETTKSLDTKMIMSSEGGFGAGKGFDPKFEFSVKGRGAATVDAGGAVGAYLPEGITGGVTVITSVKLSEKNDDFNEFEISGVNYPQAQPLVD
jgi:hypothetical protein